MNPLFNPPATFPFTPDQTDFLTYRGPHGFGAIELNAVEGILPNENGAGSAIFIKASDRWYESVEDVPVLVARYAAIKHLRYTKEREAKEIMTPNPLIQSPVSPSPSPSPSPVKWGTKGTGG